MLAWLKHGDHAGRVRLSYSKVRKLPADFGRKSEIAYFDANHARLRDVAPLAGLKRVIGINLSHTAIDDISPLRGSPVRWLNINDTPVRSLKVLQTMPRLVTLDAAGVKALRSLGQLGALLGRIVSLRIARTSVRSIAELSRAKKIYQLVIADTQVRDLRPLRSAASSLQLLDVSGVPATDFTPITGLSGRLWRLSLARTSLARLQQLGKLEKLQSLKSLDLAGTKLRDLRGIGRMRGAMMYLALDDTKQLADISAIKSLSSLSRLYLDGSALKSLRGVEGCRTLRTIYLRQTRVRDLRPLQKLKKLTWIYVDKRFDRAEVARFRRARDDVTIFVRPRRKGELR
jgi:internalin A